jgi:solute carrier family 25 (mitochondrial phosphate transporter), member 23/24/25/41
MQVVGMKSSALGDVKYNGALEAFLTILRTEGIRGCVCAMSATSILISYDLQYRGLWPNLLKVAPSIATSFFTYELVRPVTHIQLTTSPNGWFMQVKEFLIPP